MPGIEEITATGAAALLMESAAWLVLEHVAGIGPPALPRRELATRAMPIAAVAVVRATTAIHATAGRVDFAKYQSVTASGQCNTCSPDFAVDGIVSNFHSIRTSGSNNPHWLEVKYPRAVLIGSAHLYLGLDNDPAHDRIATRRYWSHVI